MPWRRARLAGMGPWHAAAAYTVLTLVATWPLARGLGRDVPTDLGEPLLAMWALAWGCEQLLAILTGDFSRIETFFDANVFHPAPLTLAYSEHFIAQAVQALPVYAIARNPILCYNLLFLSTFILSGLGTYLLVRELTGRPGAAFLAGVLFAFAPSRLAQASLLQVLSVQWAPLVLYGARRYFETVGRPRRASIVPLAGSAAALVALNLSSVYWAAYFGPVIAAYAAWEITIRRRWREWRTWAPLAAAYALAVLVTLPAAVPYVAARQLPGAGPSRAEVLRHSADVYSYATAYPAQPVWGDVMQAFPKRGAELFPGVIPLLLSLGAIAAAVGLEPRVRTSSSNALRPHDVMALAAGTLASVHVAAIGAALLYRRVSFEVGFLDVSISNIDQLLLRAAALTAVALALSPAARRVSAAFMRGPGFFCAVFLAAVWLSLGPMPQALGRPVELFAPYALLHEYVPGVAALSAPARLAMVAALMLAVLGGLCAAALLRWRGGRLAVPVLGVLFLAESLSLPFPVNAPLPAAGFNLAASRVYRPGRAPGVYKEVARLPEAAAIAELPLGSRALDLRAMFYSTVHWRALLNGYGEIAPGHYDYLTVALSDVPRHADAAADALRAAGITHAVIHEDAYVGTDGSSTTAALLARGATELFRDGADVLLALP